MAHDDKTEINGRMRNDLKEFVLKQARQLYKLICHGRRQERYMDKNESLRHWNSFKNLIFLLYIDGSVQDCSSYIVNALELLQYCNKQSID